MQYDARATKVHKSLLEVKTFLGVESRLAILNGTLTMALSMALESFTFVVLGFCMHYVLRWLTKKDIHLMAIYGRFNVLGSIYDPWPHVRMKMNSRPEGFGKGVLC